MISVGNNGKIKVPVFEVNDDNHLLVSNLYLVAEAKDGITGVIYANDKFEVSLNGLDNGDVLTVKDVKAVNTQADRINTVTLSEDGKKVVQISNNGRHMIGVTLEANGAAITDPSEIIYSVYKNGNLGMTTPENTGNGGEFYTYGLYMKYKDGDYTAADAKDITFDIKLVAPGKGHVDMEFILHAQEYTA